ncbi:hypothetical protein CJ030_MR8G015393 [Morella rubra]|uniref:Uncharacterized protein n=1 Tax=Morella rubra TaxID=262757 RepID=A0A6A1UWW5_9ROSI|nr:hypothetical protein CJ030_MR8G015393 [Morella rubra]
MYSFTAKASFVLQVSCFSSSSSSLSASNCSPRLCSSITFPTRAKFRGSKSLTLKIHAYDSSKNDTSNASDDSKPSNGSLPKSRREILLEYVQNVEPEFMELFVKRAPQQVVDAMRQTVTNMIGTLPPQFFAVTVTTVAENLAQLMYSVMMTGYMFKNAQYRLELQQSLEQVALPDLQEQKDAPDYAPGTQKNVTGEVIKWNNVSGPERIDAKKYIELLEAEIEELNSQVGRKSADGQNELLEYLRTLEPQNLKDAPDYAPGTQKNVTGEVIKWNNVSGPERIDAKKYIELLEAEIEELNSQVGRKSADGQNELLEYLRTLEPQNLKDLTSSAGEDVVLAMNMFIKRLLVVSDSTQIKTSVKETSAPELAKLLYWLMVVGYSIRNIEVRFDMERVLGTPPKLAELPPGEDV